MPETEPAVTVVVVDDGADGYLTMPVDKDPAVPAARVAQIEEAAMRIREIVLQMLHLHRSSGEPRA
jgi:hypothetical protein